jgi:hypothetical protein
MNLCKKTRRRVATIALCVWAFGLAAHATTLVRMDLGALAWSAELIIRARFTGSETRWENGAIWTFADFAVIEPLKGAPPATVRVRLPGGRTGHMGTRIEGVPQFATGEEAVLFLERTSAGDYGITSWAQGTFRVRRSAAGGETTVTQDTSHYAVFDPRTRRFTSDGVRDLPLSAFRTQVAAAIAARGRMR